MEFEKNIYNRLGEEQAEKLGEYAANQLQTDNSEVYGNLLKSPRESRDSIVTEFCNKEGLDTDKILEEVEESVEDTTLEAMREWAGLSSEEDLLKEASGKEGSERIDYVKRFCDEQGYDFNTTYDCVEGAIKENYLKECRKNAVASIIIRSGTTLPTKIGQREDLQERIRRAREDEWS